MNRHSTRQPFLLSDLSIQRQRNKLRGTFRRMLVESLEARQLLATTPISILTGDLAQINLTTLLPSAGQAEFHFTRVSTVASNGSLTQLVSSGAQAGRIELINPLNSQPAGVVLMNSGFDSENQFLASGQLVLIPGTGSNIPNDTNSSIPGFQGSYDIEFTYTMGSTTTSAHAVINVGAGFSITGDLKISTATARLDIAKIQQRLNYLGFTGSNLLPLPIDGVAGIQTKEAIKLFKAATFSTGEVDVTEISDENLIDARLVNWLNSTNAPSWTRIDSLSNPNKYTTDWVANTLQSANAPMAGQTVWQRVRVLSAQAGTTTPYGNSQWGSHLSGMDADLDIAGLNQPQLITLLTAIADASAGANQARAKTFRLRTSTLNDAVAAAFNGLPQASFVKVVTVPIVDLGAGVLHVDFVPPPLDLLAVGDADQLISGLKQLASEFQPRVKHSLVDKPLPLVGLTQLPEPIKKSAAAVAEAQFSVGEATNSDERLASLFQAIASYIEQNPNTTLSQLQAYLDSRSDLNSVRVSENEDEILIAIEYQPTIDLISRPINLGVKASDRGVSIPSTAVVSVPLQPSLRFRTTIGLQRADKQIFLDKTDLQMSSTVALDNADNFDFPVTYGIADLSINNASLDMLASLDLTRDGRMMIGNIQNQSFDQLFSTVNLSHIDFDIPTSTSILGVSVTGFSVSSSDVFAGDPDIVFDQNNACAEVWTHYSANELNSMIQSVGDFLDGMAKKLTITTNIVPVDDAIKKALRLKETWQTFSNALQGVGGTAAFQSIQDFVAKINAELPGANLRLDTNNCTLVLDIAKAVQWKPIDVGGSFIQDIGHISALKPTGPSNLKVQTDAELSFSIGLDLNPLGYSNPITLATKAKDLNGGVNPLDLNVDGANDLRIALGTGESIPVNFDSLPADTATVGNILAILQSQTAGKMTADLIDGRIVLTDITGGTAQPFSVQLESNSLAAQALGIWKTVNDYKANGHRVLKGDPIHGDRLDKHVFIPVTGLATPHISAELDIDGTNLNALANFGFVHVGIAQGTIDANAKILLALQDPGVGLNDDGRITLDELLIGATEKPGEPRSVFSDIDFSGAAKIRLPLEANFNGQSLVAFGGGQAPAYRAEIDDITKPTEVKHGFEGDLTGLTKYAFFQVQTLIDWLEELEKTANKFDSEGIMAQPLVDGGKTLGQLVGIGGAVGSIVNRFKNSISNTLQDVGPRLNQIAADVFKGYQFPGGGSGEGEEYFSFSIVGDVLKMHTHLPFTFAESFKLKLDLSKVGLEGLTALIPNGGSSIVSLDGGLIFNADMGIDFANSANPKLFIFDSTKATIGIQASAENVQFEAGLGALGVKIKDGYVRLDADGAGPSTAPVSLTLGIANNNGDGRHYFDEPIGPDLTLIATGKLAVRLPLNNAKTGLPIDSAVPAILLTIDDFTDIVGSTNFVMPNVLSALNAVDLGSDLLAMTSSIDGLFTILDTAVDAIAFAAKLPLIGDQLKDASRFLTDVRDKVKDNLSQAGQKSIGFVQQKLYEALGPDGLNLLGRDAPLSAVHVLVDGIAYDPQTQTLNHIPNEILFDFDLQSIVTASADVGFDIGIPGLGFELDGDVRLELGASMHVGLGLSRSLGVFLDASRSNEIQFQVLATVPNFRATGKLGLVQIDATDLAPNDPNQRTQLEGRFGINVKGGSDNRLTLQEITSGRFDEIVEASFSGNARVNLDFRTSVNGSRALPNIAANFYLNWDFLNASTTSSAATFGNAPTIELRNIRVDLGDAVNNIIQPILKEFDAVIEPLDTIFDVLTEPLPVVSEFLGKDFNLLRVIRLAAEVFVGKDSLKGTEGVVLSVAKIVDVLDILKEGSLPLPIEDVVIGDIRGLESLKNHEPRNRSGSLLSGVFGNSKISDIVNNVKDVLSNVLAGGPSLPTPEFPIVENPASAINLLFGKDIPLVTWELVYPTSKKPLFDFDTPVYYGTGLFALKGNVKSTMRLAVGFDTRGFRQFIDSGDAEDIFNGFYVSDNHVNGVDLPEASIDIDLLGAIGIISPPPSAAAKLIGLDYTFDVGIGGGIEARGTFDLKDGVDNDGLVHWDELYHNLQAGAGCAFDIQGEIGGSLKSFAKIKASVPLLGDITFLDEEVEYGSFHEDWGTVCRSIVPASDVTKPASLIDGKLVLSTTEQADTFTLVKLSNGLIRVSRTTSNQTISFDYENVVSILGDGKAGNDSITVDASISLPVELHGGSGDDTLQGGSGPNLLFGDLGRDTLKGRDAADTISGGLDDDFIWGYGGKDTLGGDDGADEIRGGNDADAIEGGLGNDKIWGEEGDDTINAGASNDTVWGGSGNDLIRGGLGSDDLFGDGGNDTIYAADSEQGTRIDVLHLIVGGDGSDVIYGDLGADQIFGDNQDGSGTGNDTINALDGNNTIAAGLGNDYVTAGKGVDIVWLGAGNDTASTGDGADEVHGEAGNDMIVTGAGNDRIWGDADDDKIYAGIGSDEIYGGAGNDLIQAGEITEANSASGQFASTHIIDAGDGDNIVYGDLGNDTVTTGSGRDAIYTFAGNDAIRSGAGDDYIEAGGGSDFVVAGLGSDTIIAGVDKNGSGAASDRNTVYGDNETDDNVAAGAFAGSANADTIYGDVGDDTIWSNTGNDVIYGLGGSNIIYAGWGADTVYTGTINGAVGVASDTNQIWSDPDQATSAPIGSVAKDHGDTVFGSQGVDVIWTGPGSDTVTTYSGNDNVRSGEGDDRVDAGDGDNTIDSGDGDDLVTTGSGTDYILTGIGNDQVSSGAGRDEIFVGAGNDIVDAGEGDDFVEAGDGDDQVTGGAGRDIIWGGTAIITAAAFRRDEEDFFLRATNFPGAQWSVELGMVRNVPRILGGLAVAGTAADGSDRLRGNEDDDWIWGGGQADDIDGGAGDDYLDGGDGQDQLSGGAGRDTMRGGSQDDTLSGGEGIDQLFGDGGTDNLFGDGGEFNTTTGQYELANQRLFGGDGIDYLYSFSYSITDAAIKLENLLQGDELHGGSGNDMLFGSIRKNTIYGDDGDETIYGDALAGPGYAAWSQQQLIGGSDILVGGSGFDRLYGGGGNDSLYGGFDSDLLEGQNGVDRLYGGPGIDKLIFDVSPTYDPIPDNQDETFDGHGPYAPAPSQSSSDLYADDDNATDILIIAGTDAGDTIRLGQVEIPAEGSARLTTKLAIQIGDGTSQRVYTATWRSFVDPQDDNGVPLIEQFQITGLGGNDRIDFIGDQATFVGFNANLEEVHLENVQPLDVSDLTDRGEDWVTVINGGDGDDTILGSNARDRIDGGRGDDVLYGFAGDDQLWGDGGAEQGEPNDHDRLFAGGGNDDLIGGQGTNQLYAWSFDPDGGLGQLQFTHLQSSTSQTQVHKLVGNYKLPVDGRLAYDAVFALTLGDNSPVLVRVPADSSNNNRADLLSDVIAAITSAGLSGQVAATLENNRLVLTSGSQKLTVRRNEDFGVYVDAGGVLYTDSGDHIGGLDANGNAIPDGILDADQNISGPKRPARTVQDTGLNRVMGGPRGDKLFGGTGLDFLYGNGEVGGTDQIYDRSGKSFEDLDSGLAGEEWKNYAKSTNKVWYYGGSNLDDVITVDYVTEPGLLQQRHLITRLSNNGGNFTFDARLHLDFSARDASGKLIWNPDDSWYGVALVGARTLDPSQTPDQPVQFSLSVDGNSAKELSIDFASVPPTQEAWLEAIQNALKDVGLGDKLLARLSEGKLALTRVDGDTQVGGSMQIFTTNATARRVLGFSDEQRSKVGFVGSRGLAGLLPPEGDFQAIIVDALGGNDTVNVGPTVTKSVWTDGGAGNDRILYASGSAILIDNADSLARNDSPESAFDLDGSLPNGAPGIEHNWRKPQSIIGMTLDNPEDHDWYSFKIVDASQLPIAGDFLRITSLAITDQIQLKLYGLNSNGQRQLLATSNASTGLLRWSDSTQPIALNQDYWLEVVSNKIPTKYQIDVLTRDWAEPNGSKSTALDLTTGPMQLQKYAAVSGLSLNTANDEDWFQFEIEEDIASDDVSQSIAAMLRSGESVKVSILQNAELRTTVISSESRLSDISLAGLSKGRYFLRVQFNNPAISTYADYEVRPRFGSSRGTLVLNSPLIVNDEIHPNNPPRVLDLSSQVKSIRRDVLLGSAGDDVLIGGSFEDWILGGDGNDVLSGGKDRQVQDLLWGGSGDDIFQILPDQLSLLKSSRSVLNAADAQTQAATQSDRFDGGIGNDQVLYLGGDLDAQGRVIPDFVSITYDPIVARHALTSRVWDTENQHWMVDAKTGQLRQDYVFFTTTSTEQWVIDTQAGNDEVHADEEYKIPGAYSSGITEWGIKAGMVQQRALGNLIIRGGAGADRLFGGAGDDSIDGGTESDVIVGGMGNDSITGGTGDDWLAGNVLSLMPDRYEYVSGQNNDLVVGAVEFSDEKLKLSKMLAQDLEISGLTLHSGDQADWYILAAPTSQFDFGGGKRALIQPNMISVSPGFSTQLFAAQRDAGSGAIQPVEQFEDVPAYYMLKVSGGTGPYSLTFESDTWAKVTKVDANDSVAQGGATALIPMSQLVDTPAFIPLGDLDNDGRVDFVSAFQTSGSSTIAKVTFGSPLSQMATSTSTFNIQLPATSFEFISGDFNGDNRNDIAVFTGAIGSESASVRILLGRPRTQWASSVSIMDAADVIVVGGEGLTRVASGGDINGDHIDDLMFGYETDNVVRILWGSSAWSLRNDATLASFNFDSSLHNFTALNQNSSDPAAANVNWHQSDLEPGSVATPPATFIPGHTVGGTAAFHINTPEEVQSFDVGAVVKGQLTSPPISLAGSGNQPIELSFVSLLETENRDGEAVSYDKAVVRISKSPDFPSDSNTMVVAANGSTLFDCTLGDRLLVSDHAAK